MKELPFEHMSVRVCCGLKRAAIFSYEELKEKTEKDLLGIRNFGRKSLMELRELLLEENNINYFNPSTFPFFKAAPPKMLPPIKARLLIALLMRRDGKKYREIGDHFHVCAVRARQMVMEAERDIKRRETYLTKAEDKSP